MAKNKEPDAQEQTPQEQQQGNWVESNAGEGARSGFDLEESSAKGDDIEPMPDISKNVGPKGKEESHPGTQETPASATS